MDDIRTGEADMNIDSESERLRNWYVATGRRFIETEAPDRLAALDAVFDRLTIEAVPDLPICFLGAAGVGKSTLLNSLVAGHLTIVPQGGIGPLTAQATLIRYGARRRFRATYLPASSLNKLLFALERSFEAEQRRLGSHVARADDSVELDGDETVLDLLLEPDLDGPVAPVNEKLDAYRRQASQLIQGVQYAGDALDQRYLMDAIRRGLGRDPRWDSTPRPEDEARIHRVRQILAARDSARDIYADADADPATFFQELFDHAAGHLAPLIRTLEVWWDAPVLQHGLVLVDLPGIGVANNEEHRQITAEWIRRARAVVMVVDRAGVTEASADMLRSSGFLNSLLHEGDDPTIEAARLFVATVKLDLIASDARDAERQRLGDQARKWSACFDEACERSIQLVRGQLRSELMRLCEDGAESSRMARQEVVERVLAELEVMPLSPFEYRRFLSDDEDARPLIKTAEASRVPAFAARLAQIGETRAEQLRARALENYTNARNRAAAAIQLVIDQWQAGGRAAEEAARLRDELLKISEPLEAQMYVRRGQFRELMRNGIPQEIAAQTEIAAHDAGKDIARHLRKYQTYHHNTLAAAVRRGGAFDGARNIDLPNELTLRFEEPLIVVWSRKILPKLRRATREITEDYESLVGQIVDWARAQGGRVDPALVEGLRQELAAQAREVGDVGKEAIGELKEPVKLEIYKSVETEVRKRCIQFVSQKRDAGSGMKARVLEFFRELAETVVEVAHPAAAQVFATNFRRVEDEIVAALGRVNNPIRQAVDSIVSEHETQRQRSDADHSRQVIAAGQAALGALSKLAQELRDLP